MVGAVDSATVRVLNGIGAEAVEARGVWRNKRKTDGLEGGGGGGGGTCPLFTVQLCTNPCRQSYARVVRVCR